MALFRKTLEQSLSLASKDRVDEAVSKLEEGIKEAIEAKDPKWASLLSKNAALICEQKGDLDAARHYYQVSLRYDRPDPYLHFALAILYQRLGKTRSSRRYFNSCYELVRRTKNKDLLAMLERSGYKKRGKA